MPADVTQKLNAAVIKILDLSEVRERLQRDAIETRAMTSDEFTKFVASEISRWVPLAKEAMPKN